MTTRIFMVSLFPWSVTFVDAISLGFGWLSTIMNQLTRPKL